jgi:hypothetical protein
MQPLMHQDSTGPQELTAEEMAALNGGASQWQSCEVRRRKQ